jgi:hypothetical protein
MIYPQYGYPSPTYYPQQMQNMYNAQQQQQPVQQQIRGGGIVSVANEDEARRNPVAPGFTVTMRDEAGPYLYEKTMGYSQLDQPIFRKARIVFEDDAQATENKPEKPSEPPKVYAELKQLEALRDAVAIEFKKMRDLFETIRAREEYHD